MIKTKYILIFIYLILISIFIYNSYHFFEINTLDGISINEFNQKINKVIKNKYYYLVIYLFLFCLVWVFMLGFISPILLIAGYLISPVYGALIVSLANALAGSLLVYLIRKYYLDDIEKFFPKKIDKVIQLINKDTNYYFFIFRFAGGFGIPSQLQNLIPSVTSIKLLNYFIISFIGCIPVYYISTTIGYSLKFISDLESIDKNLFTNSKLIISAIALALIIWFIRKLKNKIKI